MYKSPENPIRAPYRLRNFKDAPAAQTMSVSGLPQEYLPFTVRLVRDEHDLHKAVDVRHRAYARHMPTFAESLRTPESNDKESGVVVLLAESKLDGSPLGTMRIQTNRHAPLTLEQSVALPAWLHASSLAEATRLGVSNDKASRVVKTALFKAYYLYCVQEGVAWMVIAGRAPIDRQYERLLFNDVYPGMGYVPLLHAHNMPHRIMSFEVATAKERWAAAQHPLYNFVFTTDHPDIQVQGPVYGDQEPMMTMATRLPAQMSM